MNKLWSMLVLLLFFSGFLTISVAGNPCAGIRSGYLYDYQGTNNNCTNKVYWCGLGDVKKTIECPEGQYVLADSRDIDTTPQCYSTSALDCSSKPGYPNDMLEVCKTQNLADGDYDNSYSCKKYISCSNKITYFRDCPNGLYFNYDGGWCDTKDQVFCLLAEG